LIIIRRIPALFYDTQITELFESLSAILGSVLHSRHWQLRSVSSICHIPR